MSQSTICKNRVLGRSPDGAVWLRRPWQHCQGASPSYTTRETLDWASIYTLYHCRGAAKTGYLAKCTNREIAATTSLVSATTVTDTKIGHSPSLLTNGNVGHAMNRVHKLFLALRDRVECQPTYVTYIGEVSSLGPWSHGARRSCRDGAKQLGSDPRT